mmetsp:Transcript_2778/g.3960  ORF Transcript_2778/g.3960 Transcript_2778/m.3960 type:complete len:211 (+) Transcript_2778:174-806(+)|eukprot:CAMPEP_0117757166 /NCGR_PEP_ID=MMETSP0947-20121206/14551_1 /TAXON_ID=44440 /ORGANISM="Chattonella subsalsa, Strain CCMP2191" /LENGTH=210 /DNA_ID=CAMNT_0005576971 /DNA_START=142 /DNA_END=774 /DNA_ORIENTATION=+
MTESLLWTHFSESQLRELEAARDPDECKGLLTTYLNLEDLGFDAARQAIILDFHFYNYAYCKKMGFSPEKISTFLSIMKEIIDADIKRDDAISSLQPSYNEFKRLLLLHSIERSPWSVGIFTVGDVQQLAEYALNGYFRQFRLYKYLFTQRIQVEFVQTLPGEVSKPRASRPLAQGLPQSVKVYGNQEEDGTSSDEQKVAEDAVDQPADN